VEHLEHPGVALHTGVPVAGLEFDGRRLTGVRVGGAGSGPAERITADHYVAALPVEQLRLLLIPELRRAEPAFRPPRPARHAMDERDHVLPRPRRRARARSRHLRRLGVGATSISQAQFWGGRDLAAQYGDGRVEGILSVDVSEWERPGPRTGNVAAKCMPEEIRAEVWEQLVDHLNDGAAPLLDEANVLAWFLDPAIEFPNPTEATDLEPLLINTAGSWADRPEAVTRIPDLVLASDFVRTRTDLATMEGANEAARRAVDAILAATGSTSAGPRSRCCAWPPTAASSPPARSPRR
jgi:hypothetical protein